MSECASKGSEKIQIRMKSNSTIFKTIQDCWTKKLNNDYTELPSTKKLTTLVRFSALWHLQADTSQVVKRYQQLGIDGLQEHSRQLHSSPNAKINNTEETLTFSLRKERSLDARRIQNELNRENGLSLSLATIHKVLTNNNVKPISE